MPVNRSRQSLVSGILPAVKRARVSQQPDALIACVRQWGSAFWVFEGLVALEFCLYNDKHLPEKNHAS